MSFISYIIKMRRSKRKTILISPPSTPKRRSVRVRFSPEDDVPQMHSAGKETVSDKPLSQDIQNAITSTIQSQLQSAFQQFRSGSFPNHNNVPGNDQVGLVNCNNITSSQHNTPEINQVGLDNLNTHLSFPGNSRVGPATLPVESREESPVTGNNLQNVLRAVLGNGIAETEGEISAKHDSSFLAEEQIPLGANIPIKVKQKIIKGEYVDLYSIINPGNEGRSIAVDNLSGQPTVRFTQAPSKRISHIEQWTRAMHIFGAIYLPSATAEIPAFFKYLEFIRNLARSTQSNTWIDYDEAFRRSREHCKRAWDSPLIIKYMHALMTNQLQNKSKMNEASSITQNVQPFRQNPLPRSQSTEI